MRDGMASRWADEASAIIDVANTGNTEHRSVIAWGFRSEGGMQPLTHATAAAGSRYRRRPEPVPRIRLARQPASSETLAIVAKALYWWS